MAKAPGSHGDSDDFRQRIEQQMQRSKGDQAPDAPSANANDTDQAAATNDEQEPYVDSSSGPVGAGERVVKTGDCISSIAVETGHFWEKLWNDPGNSELKSVRKNPNVLLKDDRVHVPELDQKEESCQTEMHHKFVRKGEPTKLRLRLVKDSEDERAAAPDVEMMGSCAGRDSITDDPQVSQEPVEDEPRANVPYMLDIDGERTEGTTDPDGNLEVPIPGNARRGKLILNPGTQVQEEFSLQLGHLSPITETVGVKQRLANLTFDCGDRGDEMTDGLREALKVFQQRNGLEPNGELTEETRQKIHELHGS